MEKLTTWHEFLIEELVNREEAMSYLQVSLEEYLSFALISFVIWAEVSACAEGIKRTQRIPRHIARRFSIMDLLKFNFMIWFNFMI